MTETAQARLKRMSMRSWRRGTKEMDLVLGPWSDAHLAQLTAEQLDLYEAVLAENDQDLMSWILGQTPPPAPIAAFLDEIGQYARNRLTPKA
jgi:antitoxin CptB